MKIGIDITALTSEHTGVDRFLLGLVNHLARTTTDDFFCIFVNREDLPLFRGRLPDNFRLYGLCYRPRLARLLFQQLMLPVLSLSLRLDAIHSPSFIMPLWRGKARHILTIHDLTTLTLPEVHIPLRSSKLFSYAMIRSIRNAHVVHVPSRFVKRDIESRIEGVDRDRIRVIPHGIDSNFSPAAAERAPAVAKRLEIPGSYILYVGNIDPRKNLVLLVRCYFELVRRAKIDDHLVICGPWGWGYAELRRLCESDGLGERIHFTGYIPESDLPALIAGARLFVYPSLEEGFGFPPLEALACGVPVIAGASSSLIENLQGAASLVPVEDEAALIEEMARLLSDETLRARRRDQGLQRAAEFSWERTTRGMLAAYRGDEPSEDPPSFTRS